MSATTTTSFHRKVYTSFFYGRVNQCRWTDRFDFQTNIEEINQFVQEEFGSYLQNNYFIQFNNPQTNKLINLDQIILNSDDNPFKNISFTEDPFVLFDVVELYIVDHVLNNIDNHEQETNIVNSLIPTFKFSVVSTQVYSESQSQQESSVNSITTNVSSSHGDNLSSSLPEHRENGLFINNGLVDQEFNIDTVSIGTTTTIQNNSSTTFENTNVQLNFDETDRIYFTLDVNSIQKGKYNSNKFNQRDTTKTNGYISHIQGKKEGRKPKVSVLPRIHIPQKYRNQNTKRLRIHVVYQKKLLNGNISWIKHPNKKFLPACYNRNTVSTNPIAIPFNEMTQTKEDDFELSLKMVNNWDKSDEAKQEEEIYQLSEQLATDLHSVMDLDTTKYNPKTPRLLGMVEENDEIVQNTIFLSDFIRSSYDNKRKKSTTVNS